MELVGLALLIVFAAAVNEGIIEFIVAPAVELVLPGEGKSKVRTFVNNLISAAFGVLLGVGFNLRAIGLLGGAEVFPKLDNIITGLLIGRGSNWVHMLFKKFLVDIKDKLALIESRKTLFDE